MTRETSWLTLRRGEPQDGADDVGHAVPLLCFRRQLLAARGRETVVLGATIIFAFAPLAFDSPYMLQAIQCRVERPLLNDQLLAANC